MKQTILKNKIYLGYILYGMILTAGLLYYCFPSDAVREYVQASVSRINPQLHVSVGKVRPSFLFGLKFLKTELSQKADPETGLFKVDSLLMRPEIWSFLLGKSRYYFRCRAYGGDVKGHVHFLGGGLKSPIAASVELRDISIDHYAPLSTLIGRHVKGALGGTITYSGQDDLLKKGVGEANLRILDGSMQLLQPFLHLESIDFDELRAKLVLKNQKIDLSHVKLEGKDIKGTLSGTISLRKQFMKSGLNLKGTIELLPEMFLKGDEGTLDREMFPEQPLETPFSISGTIAEPKFKFI